MMFPRAGVAAGLVTAAIVLGCSGSAAERAASLRTSYPYVDGATVQFVSVGSYKLRVITVGSGPPLLLLHTLRTQADYFGRLAPYLARDWTVTMIDLPGHGFSDAPHVEYDQVFLTGAVSAVLHILDMHDVVIAGESIGAAIALALAASEGDCRVRSVVALNTYDYADGGAGGIARSSPIAHVLFHVLEWPVFGWIAARIQPRFALQKVLQGGFSNGDTFPDAYLNVLADVGIEPHAILSVTREHESWSRARSQYARIHVPVHLVYGSQDWSLPAERTANARAIPASRLTILPGAGHFSSLEKPALVADIIQQERGPATAPRTCP